MAYDAGRVSESGCYCKWLYGALLLRTRLALGADDCWLRSASEHRLVTQNYSSTENGYTWRSKCVYGSFVLRVDGTVSLSALRIEYYTDAKYQDLCGTYDPSPKCYMVPCFL